MNRSLLLHAVFSRMWRYKLKTLFMALGIVVSVVATVLLHTVAGSVRESFTTFIEESYPADTILVMAGSGFMGGGEGRTDLKLPDVETVAASVPVEDWDPVIYAGGRDVRAGGVSDEVGVVGHSERAATVRRRSAQAGQFFTDDEVLRRAKVALLGSTTAEALYPDRSPIGEQIFIDGVPFEIRGVLETIGTDPHGNDQDDTIQVPYTTLMDTLLKRDYISGVTFTIADRTRSGEIADEIRRVLREQHRIGEGQEDDFSVLTSALMNDLLDRSFGTFDIFVPLIAGTAFLISLVVILAIMLVSIKGRVAEIGLRKAVGARARDVQIQIVLEVLVVSVVASLVGLLLAQAGGAALTPMLAESFGVQRVVPPVTVLVIAVLAAMATGLLGGVWPARRAAKLDPVETLR
ncbi:MAG: ABC transporter permease [Acidobacteriota bacterium]